MNVSTEMKNSDEELLAGLNKEMYQLIVTHSPPDIDLYGQPFRTERLFLSVPLEHPLANRKALTPADIDGKIFSCIQILASGTASVGKSCRMHISL